MPTNDERVIVLHMALRMATVRFRGASALASNYSACCSDLLSVLTDVTPGLSEIAVRFLTREFRTEN